MMNTKKKSSVRFDAIDVFRVLCALLVIIIHCKPLLPYSSLANTLTAEGICRIAVPFFFSVSGFFFALKLSNERFFNDTELKIKTVLKSWLHIFKIYFVWSIIYFLLEYIISIYNKSSFLTLKELVWKVLFTSSHYHLWYLLSILFAMPMLFVISFCHKRIRVAAGFFFVCFYVLHCFRFSYSWLNLFQPYILDILCNFDAFFYALFCALPFLYLGTICYSSYKKQTNRYWFYRLLISGCLCIFEELIIYFLVPHNNHFEFLLTSPLVAYHLVNWLSTLDFEFVNKNTSKFLRDMSLWIYCVHPMFLYLSYGNELEEFSIVTVLSVISAMCYALVKIMIERKRRVL